MWADEMISLEATKTSEGKRPARLEITLETLIISSFL